MSFSRALGMELRPRGIRSIAVCRALVPDGILRYRRDRRYAFRYYNFFNRPEDVVAAALRDMRRGRDVSICLKRLRFQQLLAKLLPHSLVMRVWCRQQKKPF